MPSSTPTVASGYGSIHICGAPASFPARSSARSRSAAPAWGAGRSRPGRRWSRSGTATCGASCGHWNRGSAAPGAEQGVLQRVLGVVQRAEHPVAMRVELGTLLLDEVTRKLRLREPPGRSSPPFDRPRREDSPPSVSCAPAAVKRRRDALSRHQSRRAPRAAHRRPAARVRLLHASSSAGPRRPCVWGRAATWRSCWPRGSRAGCSSGRESGPRGSRTWRCPTSRASRARAGARRHGAARAARGPGGLAQRARAPRWSRDRPVAAEALTAAPLRA